MQDPVSAQCRQPGKYLSFLSLPVNCLIAEVVVGLQETAQSVTFKASGSIGILSSVLTRKTMAVAGVCTSSTGKIDSDRSLGLSAHAVNLRVEF